MADGLREVLAKYGLNEDAMAEIEEAATPETFRSQLAELGAKAKRADELESRLTSIESAPKRKEALARVGIDYDAVPKYGQKALDALPVEHLEDLNKVASYVQEQGFEANLQVEEPTAQSGAAQISEFMTTAGASAPPKGVDREALIAKANSIEEINEIVAKYPTPAE